MDEDQHDEEEGGPRGVLGRHLSKRSRRNKGLVVVFDSDARKEFVTGFHKRKKKRRKVAEKQKQLKERQKRLQDRRERRLALRVAMGQSKSEEADDDDVKGSSLDQNELDHAHVKNGTVMYEDEDTTTIVHTCSIDMNADLESCDTYKNPESDKVNDIIHTRKSSQTKRKSSANKWKGRSKRRK